MFRERIKANYNALSPSFHRLADFVLDQPLDVALMTATELAQQMDMDAATVVRFAQAIGYTGFREMLKEIRQTPATVIRKVATAMLSVTDSILFSAHKALVTSQMHIASVQ